MRQVTDESAIEAAVDAVIAANPDKVEEIKAKPKMAGWFVGQVMKTTGGKANPQTVNAILKRRLGLPDEGWILSRSVHFCISGALSRPTAKKHPYQDDALERNISLGFVILRLTAHFAGG